MATWENEPVKMGQLQSRHKKAANLWEVRSLFFLVGAAGLLSLLRVFRAELRQTCLLAGSHLCRPSTKKPTSQAKWVFFGRPTGMALRTDSIFLKRKNILAASDEDGVTKLENHIIVA